VYIAIGILYAENRKPRQPRIHAVFGEAGPCGECADGVTVRVGVAEEDFEGAVNGWHNG